MFSCGTYIHIVQKLHKFVHEVFPLVFQQQLGGSLLQGPSESRGSHLGGASRDAETPHLMKDTTPSFNVEVTMQYKYFNKYVFIKQ